jgi:hypothetical protein
MIPSHRMPSNKRTLSANIAATQHRIQLNTNSTITKYIKIKRSLFCPPLELVAERGELLFVEYSRLHPCDAENLINLKWTRNGEDGSGNMMSGSNSMHMHLIERERAREDKSRHFYHWLLLSGSNSTLYLVSRPASPRQCFLL